MAQNFIKARSWHIWASITLALPILIVGLTAVFIAHKKALGTEDIAVPGVDVLPGYQSVEKQSPAQELRAAITTSDGRILVGTQEGLYELLQQKLQAVEPLEGVQIRGLAEARFGLVVAARNGIWLEQEGRWRKTMKGDAWSVSNRADGRVAVALKEEGILVSQDGKSWQPDQAITTALATLPQQTAENRPITLHKLVMDLHTGKAFLGKKAEWIWIDVVGLAMGSLAITGIYMWWRGEKRKAAALNPKT